MAFDMAKFIARFTDEAREHIGKINEGLVILEKTPDDAETINAVFRSAHTIKGSSRMLKLDGIAEVAHKLEDALGALRTGNIIYTKAFADLLFRCVDAITDMIEKTAASKEITADNTALCEELENAAEGFAVPASREKCSMPVSPPIAPGSMPAEEKKTDEKEVKLYKASGTVRISAEKLDEIITAWRGRARRFPSRSAARRRRRAARCHGAVRSAGAKRPGAGFWAPARGRSSDPARQRRDQIRPGSGRCRLSTPLHRLRAARAPRTGWATARRASSGPCDARAAPRPAPPTRPR